MEILKLNQDYKILDINGDISVCDGKELPLNNVSISEIGIFLFGLLEKGEVTKKDMLNSVLENFEISTVLALSEIDKFVKTMKDNGIIEE